MPHKRQPIYVGDKASLEQLRAAAYSANNCTRFCIVMLVDLDTMLRPKHWLDGKVDDIVDPLCEPLKNFLGKAGVVFAISTGYAYEFVAVKDPQNIYVSVDFEINGCADSSVADDLRKYLVVVPAWLSPPSK